MIALKNIELSYAKPIIKRANLNVKKGEILGLVGKSGAGKSSLLKIIAGLIDPDKGEVSLANKIQPRVHQLLIPGFKHVAMVNQDFKLDVYHTVEENLREVVLHLPDQKRDKRVQQLLRLFDLKSIASTKAHLISGGEQQRVAVARALINKPSIIFADEPSGNLDTLSAENLHQLFFKLRDELEQTFVIVTHNEELANMADRKLVMVDGLISN